MGGLELLLLGLMGLGTVGVSAWGSQKQGESAEKIARMQQEYSKQQSEAQKEATALLLKQTEGKIKKSERDARRKQLEARESSQLIAEMSRSRSITDALLMQQLSGMGGTGDKILQAAQNLGLR